jgi:alanine racemase
MLAERLARLEKTLARPFRTYNTIELSRSALLNNFDLFQSLHPEHRIIPVLKSNAYGHGLEQITEILKARDFPYVAVDGYFEALRIKAVSSQPVLVMGAIDPANFRKMRLGKSAIVVQDRASIRALGELGREVSIHLEIDTGMHRHGIAPKKLMHFLNLIDSYPNLRLEGVMTHLAAANAESREYNELQAALFDKSVKLMHTTGHSPRYVHIGQSAGSVSAESLYGNTYRIGLGLYGINPFDRDDPRYHELDGLRPVLTLKSTVSKVNQLQKGDRVGYSGLFRAPHDMKIGVLPLGYYEGVRRALTNKGYVGWRDKSLRIVGRVCMNHTMINIEGTKAKVGDEVTVISADPKKKNSIENICYDFDLFPYEVLVVLAPTVRRTIVD